MFKTKKTIKVLGIMNGTSLDAVDFSLIHCDETLKKIKFIGHKQKNIPTAMRNRLLAAARNQVSTYELSQLHFDLGKFYGSAIKGFKNWKFDLVGVHGQTVHHEGKKATLQIGHPGFIHEVSNKPVIFDFRTPDLIDKGHAAPFAPFFQKVIRDNQKLGNVAFHNLGGISNLALFQSKKSVAFDTGPANILMDAWLQKRNSMAFDKNGAIAESGLPDPLLVNELLKHPFFKKKFPKSTGREDFNLEFLEQYGGLRFKRLPLEDQMATLAELTALSIQQAYEMSHSKVKKIYFYGGGIKNKYLMERIRFNLADYEILLTDELGWPSQAFESSTFAFLAAARYYGKKVHLPEVTGASKIQNLGSLYGW